MLASGHVIPLIDATCIEKGASVLLAPCIDSNETGLSTVRRGRRWPCLERAMWPSTQPRSCWSLVPLC